MTGTHPAAQPLGPVAASLAVLGFCLMLPVPAWAFKCPAPQDRQGLDALKETPVQIRKTASLLASGDEGNRMPEIVAELRKRHPGVRNAELVDYLVTAYCPVVARLSGLGDAEKASRLDQFAGQVSQVIYQR